MNFLALLGWAPDGETTIMSRDELVERFSLERVGSSPATFDYAKLDWMNGVYLRALPADEYGDAARRVPPRAGHRLARGARARGGADRAGEDRAASASSPGSRASSSTTSSPTRRLLDARILGAAERALDGVEPWAADGDRGRAEAALRRPGREAAHRVPADPRRRHRARGSRPGLYESLELLGRDVVARAAPRRRGGRARERLGDLVGVELGPTSWIEVTQERIDAFAAATDDPQWIHVDPARAAEGPFGTTIAHGFLTLSLCVPMLYEVLPRADTMAVNYGVEPRALPGPGAVGRAHPRKVPRARGRTDARSVSACTIEATVECDGVEKPVCVAELVVLSVS